MINLVIQHKSERKEVEYCYRQKYTLPIAAVSHVIIYEHNLAITYCNVSKQGI